MITAAIILIAVVALMLALAMLVGRRLADRTPPRVPPARPRRYVTHALDELGIDEQLFRR